MNSKIKKYAYNNSTRVITYDNDEKVLIKDKKKYNIEKVYRYLDDHNITNYLYPLKITDSELYFPYIDKPLLDNDELAKRLINSLSIMQNKTTIYKEIDKDKVREEYDKINNKLIYLFRYYQDLQDLVQRKVYMMSSEYLFIRNITLVYKSLSYAHDLLDEWYKEVKDKKTNRFVYCHGKCELDHFIAKDDGYFISLEKAHLGSPIEDFIYFYNKNYNVTDMLSNFNYYQQRYRYNKEELLFFLVNILIPKKVDIYPSSLSKCSFLVEFFDKISSTIEFVLKYKEYCEHDK